MHYRGGVFVPIAVFAFLAMLQVIVLLRVVVSRLAFVCFLDITNQRGGSEADQDRTGFSRLARSREDLYHCHLFGAASFFFLLHRFVLAIQHPHAQRQYSYWSSHFPCDRLLCILPRDHDYSCIERDRKRQFVLSLFPSHQFNTSIHEHICQRVNVFQQTLDFSFRLQAIYPLAFMMGQSYLS